MLVIVDEPPITPIIIPAEEEFPNTVQLEPLTPEIVLFRMVIFELAEPVPTVIPLPP